MWHVVKRAKMQGLPFDIILKARIDPIPPWLGDNIIHTVASSQDVLRNAIDLLSQHPVYDALSDANWRRLKWGASQCFLCRRPDTDRRKSPFTHQQQQLLLSKVKRTYYGLSGSHGDLILKLGFNSSLLSGSGRADGFLKAQGMSLEGYVDIHPFKKNQNTGTMPTVRSIGPFKCTMGDMHLSGDFLEYAGANRDEELSIGILIHEATHKFASTNDLVYFDIRNLTPRGNSLPSWLQQEATQNKMIHNADSIAMFCLLLADKLDEYPIVGQEIAAFDVTA